MKQTRLLLGMPITVEIVGNAVDTGLFERVYSFFEYVDATFSPFKATSEVSRINRGELDLADACGDMQRILQLAEQTRRATDGFFDIWHSETFNPSGIVKGWAIGEATERIRAAGYSDFYVDAGGDMQLHGSNAQGEKWRVGIRNPFDPNGIVKRLALSDCGVATSGLYNRGQHIYNPKSAQAAHASIASLTVIASTVSDADRFVTPTFVMGVDGIHFIESLAGFEGYQIDTNGLATMTSGFADYL